MESAPHLLVALVTAHVVGDFLLQSDRDISRKKELLILLRHALVVSILSYVFAGVWQLWQIAVIIFGSHAAIDAVKARLGGETVTSFLIDQAAHLLVILLVVLVYSPRDATVLFWVRWTESGISTAFIIAAGAVVSIRAGGFLIGMALQPFLDQIDQRSIVRDDEPLSSNRGFESGGRVIGYLERSLIFLFVLIDQLTAIGFLIAAKSIFRFGEIKDHRNRMEAEYIIIGTLMSFGYGLVTAYLTRLVLSYL